MKPVVLLMSNGSYFLVNYSCLNVIRLKLCTVQSVRYIVNSHMSSWWVHTAHVKSILTWAPGECILRRCSQFSHELLLSAYCACAVNSYMSSWRVLTAHVQSILTWAPGECILRMCSQFLHELLVVIRQWWRMIPPSHNQILSLATWRTPPSPLPTSPSPPHPQLLQPVVLKKMGVVL